MWLGIDIGTGGSRALLVDERVVVRAGCTAPHEEMTMARPLWAEQRPQNWWDAAVSAIRLLEPEAARFAAAIESADTPRLSVASCLEAAIFVDRNGDEVRRAMPDTFLEEFSIRLEPITVEQVRIARQAFQWFGKGQHPAALNFGDCFTYALAKMMREPVLFKAQDFSRTDLVAALPPVIPPAGGHIVSAPLRSGPSVRAPETGAIPECAR